jgi:hypothetical protein
MLDYIKETDRLQGIFLEVLEDTSKKELLLYLLCYVQLVRKEGNITVGLDQFLRCASKNFITNRNSWKDVLAEMNIFTITDLYGNAYTGKDIYRIDEREFYFMRIDQKYCRNVNLLSSKAIKYWGVVNKISHYGRSVTPYDAVYASAIMFNEELYEELEGYCEFQKERFRRESAFFEALISLSLAYRHYSRQKHEQVISYISDSIKKLTPLGDVYYNINLGKFRSHLSKLLKRLQKGKTIESVKIEFVSRGDNKEPFWKRFLSHVRGLLRRLKGGKRWTLTSSEMVCYYSIEACLKRQINSPKES